MLLDVHRAVGAGAPRARLGRRARPAARRGTRRGWRARSRRSAARSPRRAHRPRRPRRARPSAGDSAAGAGARRGARSSPAGSRAGSAPPRPRSPAPAAASTAPGYGQRSGSRSSTARRLAQDARVAPRAAGRRVERPPDGGDVPQPAIALRRGVHVLRRQASPLEIRDRPREGLVPAERRPEQLEGKCSSGRPLLRSRSRARRSASSPGAARPAPRSTSLAATPPRRTACPRARGPIDADQLAPQRVRHSAARHQRGATGQRAVDGQRGDRLRPVTGAPEDLYVHGRSLAMAAFPPSAVRYPNPKGIGTDRIRRGAASRQCLWRPGGERGARRAVQRFGLGLEFSDPSPHLDTARQLEPRMMRRAPSMLSVEGFGLVDSRGEHIALARALRRKDPQHLVYAAADKARTSATVCSARQSSPVQRPSISLGALPLRFHRRAPPVTWRRCLRG